MSLCGGTHRLTPSLRPVAITSAVCSVFGLAYGVVLEKALTSGFQQPSRLVYAFVILAPAISIILWLERDARTRQIGLIQDMGLFLYLAFPVVVPWYVFRTRGRQGWRLFARLLGAVLAPYVAILIGGLSSYAVREFRAGPDNTPHVTCVHVSSASA